MLVTAAKSKSHPATRCWANPCEVTSITQWVSPDATIRARYACNAGESGVVTWKPVSNSSPPITAPTVPIIPARKPALRRMLKIRLTVVVLPSVPVTPIITSDREGNPNHAAESNPRAWRLFATRMYGTPAAPCARSPTTATAPASTARGMNICPSTVPPVQATNSFPGATRRESCVTPVISGSSPG